MGNSGFRTIKIRNSSYARLQDLIGQVASKGWVAIGSKRTDAPTIANVVDESVLKLAQQMDNSAPAR
jgi:hypothetical protein